MMGTGNRINGAAMPLLGLPYRRYSVPETVMRKYSLSRAQTSESSESGAATVPTPSVPSASFRNATEEQWDSDSRGLRNKRMLHKACQTSPRNSVEKETVKNSTKEKQCKSVDNEKTIPVLHVTSDSCNDIASKVSDNETSPKNGECSQLYSDETEYYQTYDAKNLNCDVTIPGAISEPSSVFLIVKSSDEHNLEEELKDENDVEERQVQNDYPDVNKTPLITNENKKILDDLTQWISNEHIQYLLNNTTNTQKLKNMLHEKSKSFPETEEVCSIINQRSCSAHGKLQSEAENDIEITSDSDGIELRTNPSCIDDTPTPIPPSTGQTESHSSEGECYMTDCEICAAEGRKCCNLDDTRSQSFSFTSPEMISTNGFKTSSDFTSSSITLDQTVSDRSTSTQDSTLSITSITPESYNSKTTSINISPLLVINSETSLIQPVEIGGRSRDFTFHPSDSTPRTTPSPSNAECINGLRTEYSQVCDKEGHSNIIPLVINSESALINPIKRNGVNANCNCESQTLDSDSQSLKIIETELNKSQMIQNKTDNIELSNTMLVHKFTDFEHIEQTVNSSSDKINFNNSGFESSEIRQIDNDSLNIQIVNDPSKDITLSLEVNHNIDGEETMKTFEGVNFQLNQNSISSQKNFKIKSDDENEFLKDQPGDDFEMDSLAIEDSGSSDEITVTENKSSFCGSENLSKEHIPITDSENVEYFKASTEDDDMSLEETDLLEKLGFCEDVKKTNKTREQSDDGSNEPKVDDGNYDEKCRKQVQDMFYGNKKYEVIVKENKQNNNLRFMGNVISTRDDKSNTLVTNNVEKVNNCGINTYDMIDDNEKERVTEFSLMGGKGGLYDNDQCKDIILLKPDKKSISTVTSGTYWETPGMELIIPRYSAMPRTLSMLVNTSSMDYSSDSDLSLADSLEDTSISGRVKTFNKHDNRLVRGDVMALLPEISTTSKNKTNESHAYFLSLAGEEGEIKAEPIPDELKKKLLKRDNEVKKHSDHSSKHVTKKQEHKRHKKHRHHSPVKHSTSTRKDKFESSATFDIEKSCKSTQWEDIPSSRAESSDTLVLSDTSEKEPCCKMHKSTITNFELRNTLNSEETNNYHLKQNNDTKTVNNISTNNELEENFQDNDEENINLENNLDETKPTLLQDKSTLTDLNDDTTLNEERYTDNETKHLSENRDKQSIDISTNTDFINNEKYLNKDKTNILNNLTDLSSNITTNTRDDNEITDYEDRDIKVCKSRKVNKWVQCIDATFLDTETDKEVSTILLEAYSSDQDDGEEFDDNTEKLTKDAVTTTDLEENCNEQTKLMESDSNHELELETFENQMLFRSISVQTDSPSDNVSDEYKSDVKKITFSEMFQQTSDEREDHLQLLHMNIPQSESILLNSIPNEKQSIENGIEENRCKTPVFGEKPTDKTIFTKQLRNGNKLFYNNKQNPRFNVRTTPARKIGNLSTRFRQRFEVIPEEKNSSMDSSTEERSTSPPTPSTSRRASIPVEMLRMDINTDKRNDKDSISSDKLDETSDLLSRGSQFENSTESQRRHTIHGNLESRRNKAEYSKSFEQNEQNRRHTIHGNLALTSRNTTLIKKLNLMGGTVLKGRVFSKRSGVMIGQFRPMNEETQVEKDEKSAVGEQLERLRRGGCKGRQALAVTQNQEHEELLTLSKGWINFYLLKDSQDLGSDGSNGEEGMFFCLAYTL